MRAILLLLVAVAWPAALAHAQADPRAALLERDGFILLDAGDARRAAEAFRTALQSDPNNAQAHFGAGLAAYLERRDADALQAFERALTLNPQLVEARRYLGQVVRRQGDMPRAIRIYESLAARHPERQDLADTLERWRREALLHEGMRQAVGDRFTVSFDGPAIQALADRAIDSLDRAYWTLGDLLGATYPIDPVRVVLYTSEQFHDITRSPSWAAGAYDGIIRVPMRGALDKPEELDRVLTHEFAHALVRTMAARGVPTWLNEGLAAAVESDDLEWAASRVKRAGQFIPLELLATGFGRFDEATAALAYASSALAVRRMLDESGGYAMANLIRDLGDGADFDASFTRRMGRPFADFVGSLQP